MAVRARARGRSRTRGQKPARAKKKPRGEEEDAEDEQAAEREAKAREAAEQAAREREREARKALEAELRDARSSLRSASASSAAPRRTPKAAAAGVADAAGARSRRPSRRRRGRAAEAEAASAFSARPAQRSARATTSRGSRSGSTPLEQLSAICLELPEAERVIHEPHAQFSVRKRTFAYFLDDHHGDGIVRSRSRPPAAAAGLIDANPDRFYRPSYLGSRGWVSLRLDLEMVDWTEVADLVTESYLQVAPKRLAAMVTQVSGVAGEREPERVALAAPVALEHFAERALQLGHEGGAVLGASRMSPAIPNDGSVGGPAASLARSA